ncbi:MAG: ChaN family lipoprotein [Burkholderiaceae bacterium]
MSFAGAFVLALAWPASEVRALTVSPPTYWASAHYQQNLLVGTVWQGSGEPASWPVLNDAIADAAMVLVGETHPNPDHHRLQAAVLQAVSTAGKRPTVVWEMIPAARQTDLDEWAASGWLHPDRLGKTLAWDKSGWPPWAIYQPIASVAATRQLRMIGTALPRATMMSIGRKGEQGVSAEMRQKLHLDIQLAKSAQAELRTTLREGHCNLMPESALAPMAVAQRARDGAMAQAMLSGSKGGSSVLIAGNGHIRKDWGVAQLLAKLAPSVRTLSIAQIEVEDGVLDPTSYFEKHATANGYDFVIFTPRAEIKDYCADLRKRFGKK